MTTVEVELGRDLRQLVIEHVRDNKDAVQLVSQGLGVPTQSVERLLKRPIWDLSLTFRVLDSLGMSPRVTA